MDTIITERPVKAAEASHAPPKAAVLQHLQQPPPQLQQLQLSSRLQTSSRPISTITRSNRRRLRHNTSSNSNKPCSSECFSFSLRIPDFLCLFLIFFHGSVRSISRREPSEKLIDKCLIISSFPSLTHGWGSGYGISRQRRWIRGIGEV